MREKEEEEQAEECAKIVEEVCGEKSGQTTTVLSEYAVRALEEFKMDSHDVNNRRMHHQMIMNSSSTSATSHSQPQGTNGINMNYNRNENDVIHRPNLSIPVGDFQVHIAQ